MWQLGSSDFRTIYLSQLPMGPTASEDTPAHISNVTETLIKMYPSESTTNGTSPITEPSNYELGRYLNFLCDNRSVVISPAYLWKICFEIWFKSAYKNGKNNKADIVNHVLDRVGFPDNCNKHAILRRDSIPSRKNSWFCSSMEYSRARSL